MNELDERLNSVRADCPSMPIEIRGGRHAPYFHDQGRRILEAMFTPVLAFAAAVVLLSAVLPDVTARKALRVAVRRRRVPRRFR